MALIDEEDVRPVAQTLAFVAIGFVMLISLPSAMFAYLGLRKYETHEILQIRNPSSLYLILAIGSFHSFVVIPLTLIQCEFQVVDVMDLFIPAFSFVLCFDVFFITTVIHCAVLTYKVKKSGILHISTFHYHFELFKLLLTGLN